MYYIRTNSEKKKGDTKYNYPFRSFKSHLLLLLVPACSTYAQPAVRSFYQPLIRPCDISSKVTYPWRGGVKYERYFHAMLRLTCLRKKYQLVPLWLFLQTRAGIFDVSTRAGAWLFTALHV